MAERVNALKARPVYTVIGMLSFLLLVIPIPYVAGHISTVPEYQPTLVFIALSLAADVAHWFLGEKGRLDFLILVSVTLKALSFAFFALGGVLSVADYVAKIHLFGDSTQFGAIMAYGVMLLCGTVTNIVRCFMK